MAILTLRATAGGAGTTTKNSPLTIAELDNNFISINNDLNSKPTASFTSITVAGQSSVIADSAADTLTLAGTGGISILTDAATDTITIDSNQYALTSAIVADASNATRYLTFVDGIGERNLKIDTASPALAYNPSTTTLSL